ncbi:hypothetical protein HLB44_17795 [Aquincola sp. S2]|uniref:Uncharacterized protein n=1 Tax=Pseudaquabacterium terrae TaxID=2732868 RepID=A0ABX2EJQ9_9BURK|nr:hypothetical protein [Aquabacterium terrae]NRF68849.1 hypothetical protein [Aquabacterium terrae]
MHHASFTATVEGDQLARRAKDRSQAIALLRERRHAGFSWTHAGYFAAGAVAGWSASLGNDTPWLVAAAAGAALFLAAAAWRECAILRRREQAILKLLLDRHAH